MSQNSRQAPRLDAGGTNIYSCTDRYLYVMGGCHGPRHTRSCCCLSAMIIPQSLRQPPPARSHGVAISVRGVQHLGRRAYCLPRGLQGAAGGRREVVPYHKQALPNHPPCSSLAHSSAIGAP